MTKRAEKRTVIRSSKGIKLYKVTDEKGRFKDIVTYKKAHAKGAAKAKKKNEQTQAR